MLQDAKGHDDNREPSVVSMYVEAQITSLGHIIWNVDYHKDMSLGRRAAFPHAEAGSAHPT